MKAAMARSDGDLDLTEEEQNKIRTNEKHWDYEHLEPTYHGAFFKYIPGVTKIMDQEETTDFLCHLKVAFAKVYQGTASPLHEV